MKKGYSKFISFFIALIMILSSLSGFTIVTVSAEGEPVLGDWNLTAQYSEDFASYSGAQDASVINEKANNAWTWSDASGFTRGRGYQIYQNAFNMKWKRWVQYNIPSSNTSDVIAFRYTIQTNGETQDVSIVDNDNTEISLLDQTSATGEYKTFTTVVDTIKKSIYTFMPDGTVDTKSYTGDTVNGIRFENTSNENGWVFLMNDFAYMTENSTGVDENTPSLDDWNLNTYYGTEFDYADQSDASVINTEANNAWTWSDASGFTLARGYKIYNKAFNMKWTRWTQYEIPMDSATDVIAFRYKMQTKGTTQYVSIIDSDNAEVAILDQTVAASEYKMFTTVIDTTSKKIYTFMPDGSVDTTKSYAGDTVKAIRFGNTSNEGDFNFLIDNFVYLTENSETFTVGIDYETAQLTGFDEASSYTVAVDDGADTDVIVKTGGVVDIDNTWYGKKITIKKGSLDFVIDMLGVQPTAPGLSSYTVIQPTTLNGTGSITAVGEAKLEYKADKDGEWAPLPASNLAQGSMAYVRISGENPTAEGGTGTFPSASSEIKINKIIQESTPVLAIDYETETLGIFTANEKYKITAEGVEDKIKTDDAAMIDITPYIGKIVSVIKSGILGRTVDSEAFSTAVPVRPSAPNVIGNKPASESENGTITGVDNTMEYIPKATFDNDNTSLWTSIAETSVSVASGAYYVRVKASNDNKNFAGEKTIVTVPEYTAETYTIKGTISAEDSVSKVELKGEQNYTFNVTSGTEVTFTGVLAGTYDIAVTPAEGYKNGISNPTRITVNADNSSAFTASATELATVNITVSTIPSNVGSVMLSPNSSTAKENSKITAQASNVTGYDVPVIEYSTDGTIWTKVDGELTVGTDNIEIRATYTAKTFYITKASVTGGSINIAESASYGSDVEVSVTADEGYISEAITVTGDTSKRDIPITDGKFKMPAENVTVSAIFKNTTPANPKAKLSYWTEQTMTEKETNTFATSKEEQTLLNAKIVQEIEGADVIQNWTFESKNSNGSVRADNTRVSVNTLGELIMTYDGAAMYVRNAETGAYYYKYTISMSEDGEENNQIVKLIGVSDGTLFTSPNAGGTFTTVISPSDNKAYTYDENGDIVSENMATINNGEKVLGIEFRSANNSNKNIKVSNFSYGLIGDAKESKPTPAPTLIPTSTPKPIKVDSKLSDWDLNEPSDKENFDGKNVSSLKSNGWSFGNTNTGVAFNEKHVTINKNGELEINWYGTATYGKTDENESFYYTYTVKTNDTSGIRSVKLSGADNSTLLVSGKEITAVAKTFTTIMDINSKKAYTYNTETGDFINAVNISDFSSIRGITFTGGTENTNVGMQVDNLSYGLVNVTPPEKPVTIVLTSDKIDNGKKLEHSSIYEIEVEKLNEMEIEFNEPYSSKDGKPLLYMTNSIVINPPVSADGNIAVDGTKIIALETLTAGTYDVSIAVKAEYKGEEYGSDTYTVRLVKQHITDEDIKNNYNPIITTKNIGGNEITVNTDISNPTVIYNNLILPKKTSFANITWSSDKNDILSNDGVIVKRPIDDTTVTLTASIANLYGSTVTKDIIVIVKGIGGMLDDAIAKAKTTITKAYDEDSDIEVSGLLNLHQDIKLYTKYEKNDEYPEYNDVTIEWSSSDNDILKINNNIAEIYPITVNEYNIKLKVKASAFGQTKEDNIDVIVHLTSENAGDRYAVRCDDLAISNFSAVAGCSGETVSENISVPTKGIFGSIINWTSSAPMYMSNTGKYTAPAKDTNVTLTGIVSKGKIISDNKHTYSFTAKGRKSSNQNSSGGGGGSSSGGGSSWTAPSTNVNVPSNTTNSSDITKPSNTGNESIGFMDIDSVEWAKEAINILADRGIINGRSADIFDPYANITRAEFATMIVKAFGFENSDAKVDEFADVNEDDWYYSFVSVAYTNGIISGYDNGMFGSSDNITRQDMAVIIYRAAQVAGYEFDETKEGKIFDDDTYIATYAKVAIDRLVRAGIVSGISETEFAPLANATRAQAAKMTYELVK